MDSISLIILFIAIIGCYKCTAQNQAFTLEPEDHSVQIGSKILLPCRVEHKQGVLQWTKDDFGLGTNRNLTLSGYDRYTMIGTDAEGDYTLQIDPVTLDDDARYQCQVSPGPQGQQGIRSQFATLNVIVPPEPPRILQGDFYLTAENKEIELDCISIGGKPAATLTWFDGKGNEITDGVESSDEILSDGKRTTVKSTLKIKAQSEHHNTTFECRSKSEADKTEKNAEIKVEVRYAPKITLTMESNVPPSDSKFNSSSGVQVKDSFILDGSEVHFKCDAHANPDDIQYKWFINDTLVVGDYTTEMAIYAVNKSHNNAIIKCVASNDIGMKSETTTLNVHYPPTFIETPKSTEADKGEKVNLKCSADGNPLEIIWVHDPIDRINYHPKVVGTKKILKLTVSADTAGRYFCKANVPGFAEIKSAADVYLKQAPQIISSQQQFGYVGDTTQLECNAISVPRARHISWSFRGREINANGDPEFSILEETTEQGIKSILIIRNSQSWHFDKYNCSVVNDYGTDVLSVELMHSQTLWRYLTSTTNLPIFLTISVMTGLIIIVIVCFVFIKSMGRKARQGKNEKHFGPHDNFMMNFSDENSSTDKFGKDSDRSSPSSDYKIKQGSSESNYSLPSTVSDNTLLQIISNNVNGIPYEKPVAYRKSLNYDDDTYYSKDHQNSYGSITAIKNRSVDYDDNRYYIANNLRNTQFAMHPNPSPVQNNYVQKSLVVSNYPSNRFLSHVKRTTTNNNANLNIHPNADPRQDVGLPRSSIV